MDGYHQQKCYFLPLLQGQGEKIALITKDMLVNQLKRDSNRIATSFDALVDDEIAEISEMFAQAYGLLAPKIIGRDLNDKSLGPTCARLISTAMTTFIASVELARRGYRRQYMALIRSVVETIATVLHLTTALVGALWLCRHLKGDTPMDNPRARNKEVRDRAKKLEAQIMGHMFDMCWPEFGDLVSQMGEEPNARSQASFG